MSSEPPRTSPPRVLIVDPNRTALSVMARRVSEAGYRVTASDGASTALAELRRAPVDMVIAERKMPKVGGVELVRLIREDAVQRELPVILIAARSDPAGAIRALEAGADDVVVKPFHFEVLIARVARQLARARSVEQLRADNATLDARIVQRAIELGELRDRLARLEAAVGTT